jgi:hypothetical protein
MKHQIVLIDDEVVSSNGSLTKVINNFQSCRLFNTFALENFRRIALRQDSNAVFRASSNLAGGYWRLSNGDCLELR